MYTAKKVMLDPDTECIKLYDSDGNLLCYLDADEESVRVLCSVVQTAMNQEPQEDEDSNKPLRPTVVDVTTELLLP